MAMSEIRRILSFVLPHRWQLALLLITVIASAFAGIVNPLLFRMIMNDGILAHNLAVVVSIAFVSGLFSITETVLGLCQVHLSANIGSRIVFSLRTRLIAHLLKMPIAFFTRVQTGALVTRVDSDVASAQAAISDLLSNVVGNAILLMMVLAAMASLSWQITIFVVATFPILTFMARYLGERLKDLTAIGMKETARLNSTVFERFNVSGAQLVKSYGDPAREIQLFEQHAERISQNGVRRAVRGAMFITALMLLFSLVTVTVYGWGGALAATGALDIGTVVARVSYLYRLYQPLTALNHAQVNVIAALISFRRVFEVLDMEPAIRDKPHAKELSPGPAQIELDHVSFRYSSAMRFSIGSLATVPQSHNSDTQLTLDDISFQLKAGSVVALVGPSGSGKTTIAQLLLRFFDPMSGAIRINGIDLRDLTQASLHARIAVVAQDPYFFHDTLRENLAYANRNARDKDIYAALDAAQILEMIETLPQGLDTVVGERGHRFSGGEKQRLSIARALLKSPDILILDEATSHLDSASEAAVQRALDSALVGRTSLVIAHRLSTIRKADEIIVIDKGRLIERGTHETLVAAGGLYATLCKCQFSEAPNEPRLSSFEVQGIS